MKKRNYLKKGQYSDQIKATVEERVEQWVLMEPEQLRIELKKLEEHEEFHTEEIRLVRASLKALKEVIEEKNFSDDFDEYQNDDACCVEL